MQNMMKYPLRCPESHERRLHLVRVVEQDARTLIDKEGTQSTGHTADTGDGGNRVFREHVAHRGKDVGRPRLMRRGSDTDNNHGYPYGYSAQWLCEQDKYREHGEKEHGPHAPLVGIHLLFVHGGK